MKKLMLFFSALLLFAPPGANAETIVLHGIKNNAMSTVGNANGYVNGTTTSLSNQVSAPSTLKIAHNEGGFVTSGLYGAGTAMVRSYDANVSYSDLVGIQNGASMGTSNKGYDRLQMLFEVPPGSSAILHSSAYQHESHETKDIVVPAGSKIRFRTLGGTIQSVKMKLINTITVYGTMEDALKWTSDDVDITTVTEKDDFGTDLNFVVLTAKSSDCKDFTVDMKPANKAFAFTQIVGDWTPITKVKKPERLKYIWVNGEKKDVGPDGTLEINVEDRVRLRIPFSEGTSNVLMMRSGPMSTTPANPDLFDTPDVTGCFSTNVLEWKGYGSGNSIPSFADPTRLPANIIHDYLWEGINTLCLAPIYDANAKLELPVKEGSMVKCVFRPHNWAGFGDPIVVTFKRILPPNKFSVQAPGIDVDNLPEGCEWDKNTLTYYYNTYSNDTSRTAKIVFLKQPFARQICYSFDGTFYSGYQTNPVPFYTENPILPIILKTAPLPGQRNMCLMNYYDGTAVSGATSTYFQFYIEYRPSDGGNTGGGNTGGGNTGVQIVQAPDIIYEKISPKTLTLAGDVVGYITDDIKVNIRSNVNKGILQYQFIEATDNQWAETPDSKGWKPYTEELTVKGSGRLFVRENVEGSECLVDHRDFSHIDNTRLVNSGNVGALDYNKLIGLKNTANVVTVGEPVRLIGSFKFDDNNVTDNVYLMFVADKMGNVLRVRFRGEHNMFEYNAENRYKMMRDLTGELLKNNDMPELWLSSGTIDYSPLISDLFEAKDELGADYPAYVPASSDKVPAISDYSKLMYFEPLRWNKAEGYFTDNYGGTVRLKQRIDSEVYNVDEVEKTLEDGIQYRVAGYVGFDEGAPVIMPRAIVAAPRLLAPNPVNPNAAPNELINMNVISHNLTISVDMNGVAEGTKILYVKADDVNSWLTGGKFDPSKVIWTAQQEAVDNEIDITNEDLTDGDVALAVKLDNGGFESSLVAVNFIKHAATPITTIADFKTTVGNKTLPGLTDEIGAAHDYYQYVGYARVREVTDHYLYIRTTPGDGSNLPDSEDLSSHSILIYNKYGWSQPIAGISTIAGAAEGEPTAQEISLKTLEPGDVITNFALIPTHSEFGNLIGNATGFIRTFRRVEDAKPGSNNPLVKDAQSTPAPFGESDRMLRYTVRQVKVLRQGTVDNYTYTLDMPGKPVLDNGSVFEEKTAWDKVYDSNTYYDITGVLMLFDGDKAENEDGRYMLAMTGYDIPNVTPAAAPSISIKGAGTDNGRKTFITTAKVAISSADITGNNSGVYTIYYTTDGSDPRTNGTEYKGEFDITANTIVKAFVVAAGQPDSEITETLFTRTGVDTRYIVNFINQAKDEETPYHLTAYTKVVAKGGDYFFLRGTEGHYLPVKDEAGIINTVTEGDYLGDMVLTAHIVEGGAVRGAHVAAAHKELFKGKITKPAGIEEITAVPDEVTTITAANARRYVKLTNARLSNAVPDADSDAQWTLTNEYGTEIEVDHKVLNPGFNWDEASDNQAAAYYNVTGFVMLGDDGEVELWPTFVEKVTTTSPANASFTNYYGTMPSKDKDGEYKVNFYPHSLVTLEPSNGDTNGLKIYYYVADSKDDNSHTTEPWTVYGRPFDIAHSCYIHVKAKREGYEESVHTHIAMTLADSEVDPEKMSGEVVISHRFNDEGVPVVKIQPKLNLPAGSYDIFYTTDGTTPTVSSRKYTGEFTMKDGGVVLAILKETAKELPGKVASLNVYYVPSAIGGIDSDGNGGESIRVEGGNIIAPEGSVVFDLNGRLVNPTGLNRGIYIICVPGTEKAIKVKVD